VEAFARADEALARKLAQQRTEAEAHVADLDERVAGAERAAARAQTSHDAFIVEHIRALLNELTPTARAAASRIAETAEAFEDAVGQWHGVEAQVIALLRPVASIDSKQIPHISPWDEIRTTLRRLRFDRTPPAPLPDHVGQVKVTIDPPPAGLEELGPQPTAA
jgi:hypothetical protein